MDILNDDCVQSVFRQLALLDLVWCKRVSRRWRDLVDQALKRTSSVTAAREFAHFPSSSPPNPALVLALLRAVPSLQRISLARWPWSEGIYRTGKGHSMIESGRKQEVLASEFCNGYSSPALQFLDLSGHTIAVADWKTLARHCPNLRSLRMIDSDISADDILLVLSLWSPSLECLDISGCRSATAQSVRAAVDHGVHSIICRNCPGIVGPLRLNCETNSPRTLILAGSQRLESLTIENGASLDEVNLSRCTNLQRLQIHDETVRKILVSGCSKLSDVNLMTPGIVELNCFGCRFANLGRLLDEIKDADHLAVLLVNGTSASDSDVVFSSLFGLRQLDCSGVRQMSTLTIDCPNLESLSLNGSLDLAPRGILRIPETATINGKSAKIWKAEAGRRARNLNVRLYQSDVPLSGEHRRRPANTRSSS